MKKKIFFGFILILIITLGVNLWAMTLYRQRNMQSYLAAGIDKENVLMESQPPRIILVGGSNVAFGFNSRQIEQVTGRRTLNMGLQGSLGIRFQLNSLKPYLAAGDIVILSPEYNNFSYGFIGGDVLGQYLVVNPADIQYLSSIDEIYGLLKTFPNMHTSAIHSMLDDYLQKGCFLCKSAEKVYYRAAFNEYGDITTNNSAPIPGIKPLQLQLDHAELNSQKTISILNDFSDYAAQKGIQVFLVYPATSQIKDQDTLNFITQLDNKLRSQLNIPILGSINESQYPDADMFNTYYHLNTDGARIHTAQVLKWLCAEDPDLMCRQ